MVEVERKAGKSHTCARPSLQSRFIHLGFRLRCIRLCGAIICSTRRLKGDYDDALSRLRRDKGWMIDPPKASDAPGYEDGFVLLGLLTVFSTNANDRLSARGQQYLSRRPFA